MLVITTQELFKVCHSGNIVLLRTLLGLPRADGVTVAEWAEDHPEIDTVDERGRTLLHCACLARNLEMVRFLVDECGLHSTTTVQGCTPLYLVCAGDTPDDDEVDVYVEDIDHSDGDESDESDEAEDDETDADKVDADEVDKADNADDDEANAWHCAVSECGFPHLHVTSSHKCGTCGKFGHGQVECGKKKATAALKKLKATLPPKLHCSLPECSFPSAHVTAGHQCGECQGFGHSAPECKAGASAAADEADADEADADEADVDVADAMEVDADEVDEADDDATDGHDGDDGEDGDANDGEAEQGPDHAAQDFELLKLLAARWPDDVHLPNRLGGTPLTAASARGHLPIVQFLVSECHVNVAVADVGGQTAAARACAQGHLNVVQFLMGEGGADATIRDATGATPAHIACKNGHLEILTFLVANCGADVHAADDAGATPIHTAATNGHTAVVRYLLIECHADGRKPTEDGTTPVQRAFQNGNFEIVRLLVDHCHANAALPDPEGRTALWYACKLGASLEMLQFLVRGCRIDVNAADRDGVTALHHLKNVATVDVAELLLTEAGGEVNCADNKGNTPFSLLFASSFGEIDLMLPKLLVDRGARVDAHGEGTTPPLLSVASNGDIAAIRWLVSECQADPNVTTPDGTTALMEVCAPYSNDEKRHDSVAILVEAGADVNCVGNEGNTALHHLVTHIDDDDELAILVTFLVAQNGANANVANTEGLTPLQIAVDNSSEFPLDVVKVLVTAGGASVNVTDEDGSTPLISACSNSNLEAVTFLVRDAGATVNVVSTNGVSPLVAALQNEDVATVRFLVADCSADLHAKGQDLLHTVSNVKMARFLVTEYGFDVNATDATGSTPLIMSCTDLEIVKYLVTECGANIHHANDEGLTVLHTACGNYANDEIIEFLIKNGANGSAIDKRGNTPFMCTMGVHPSTKCLALFVGVDGLDFDHANEEGDSILHMACAGASDLDIVKFLVEGHSVRSDRRNKAGRLPIDLWGGDRKEVEGLLFASDGAGFPDAGVGGTLLMREENEFGDGSGSDSYHGLTDPLYLSPDRFPSVFWNPTRVAYPPNLQRRMWAFAAALRRKTDWPRKVASPELRDKWRTEAVENSAAAGIFFPMEVANRVLDVVLKQAELLSGGGVLGGRPAPVDGVWESDGAVDAELMGRLTAVAAALRASQPIDHHPGSDGLVVDLLHPSLFCFVSGVTQVARSVREGTTQAAVPNPVLDKLRVYQWLPSIFSVDAVGSSTVASPLTGHYDGEIQLELHSTLASVFDSVVPMFERVLEDSRNPQHRDHFAVKLGDSGEDEGVVLRYCEGPEQQFCLVRVADEYINEEEFAVATVKVGTVGEEGTTTTKTFKSKDRDIDELMERAQKYANGIVSTKLKSDGFVEKHPPGMAPSVVDFKPPHRPFRSVSLRGRSLRVIAKLATIELTSEKPAYGGGAWHVEGEPQECIVATAICYYSQENITASRLRFRAAVEPDSIEATTHEDPNLDEYEGLHAEESRLSIDVGWVDCIQGRSVAFPNLLQHRVDPFRLVDPSKPGYRSIVAFFLVDPAVPVLSTMDVSLQSCDYMTRVLMECQGLRRLPLEVLELILGFVEGVYDLGTAKRYREGLMDERRSANARLEDLFVDTDFSLCEH